jgi:nitroreductase
MKVYEAVKTVLALLSYQPKPIPPEVIQHIVEAAHLTAGSMNLQPWHQQTSARTG